MQGRVGLGWPLEAHSLGVITLSMGSLFWTLVTVASVTFGLEVGKGGTSGSQGSLSPEGRVVHITLLQDTQSCELGVSLVGHSDNKLGAWLQSCLFDISHNYVPTPSVVQPRAFLLLQINSRYGEEQLSSHS